jgi:hypothetical protein
LKANFRRALNVSLLLAALCLPAPRAGVRVEAAQSQPAAAQAPVAAPPDTIPSDPFQADNGLIPEAKEYAGSVFHLSRDWPVQPLSAIENPPWLKAIGGGPITTQNAAAYVAALKQYVSANARTLLLDYPRWDAAKARWYNEPWMGSMRESIHGTYPAGQFGPSTFPGTGLKTTFDSHVVTYYDERAAHTLYKIWGVEATNPTVATENFQFDEGSVIVKAAVFVSDDTALQKDWWDATKGAAAWPIYTAIPVQRPAKPAVLTGYVMQFDIMVKDRVASPKTGWVFAALVYDRAAPGDAWDKMVPLGATWGNDPAVDSAANPRAELQETWINPAAPKYATKTLGWGGRLAGPNDGSRNDIQVGKKSMDAKPNSSCLSCHGTAEWQPDQHKQISFLMPSYPNPHPGSVPYKLCGDGKLLTDAEICSPAPGSPEWSQWFQDRPGTEPQDKDRGSVATDYDMVFAFKTLPMWWRATGVKDAPMPFALRTLRHGTVAPAQFNEYTGAPLQSSPTTGTGQPKAIHWQ